MTEPLREIDLASARAAVARDLSRLHTYFKATDFGGWDPYDGLESRLFKATALRQSKWARLAMIQGVKRSPWNLRPILGVPRARNPKGIALCASAFVCQSRLENSSEHLANAANLMEWLLQNRISGYEGDCWGYNFAWQSRSFYAPRGLPNAICTIFAARAALDHFDQSRDSHLLELAQGATRFLIQHLKVEENGELRFRYIPTADSQVHNVNLLAAALLARVANRTKNPGLLDVARRAVSFSSRLQRPDGSWPYGEADNQCWIDNYHTGFNLLALSEYELNSQDDSFKDTTKRGYQFWDSHFSSTDGAPKFYANQLHPVDAHCVAQSIITLLEFSRSDPEAIKKCLSTYQWARAHLQSKDGWFYFQRHTWYTIRTCYTRWAQAWMFLALSRLQMVLASHQPQNTVTLGEQQTLAEGDPRP
jgi:hypothetical protein